MVQEVPDLIWAGPASDRKNLSINPEVFKSGKNKSVKEGSAFYMLCPRHSGSLTTTAPIAITVKTLNIGTPRLTTVVVLNIKQFDFTTQECLQKM